ncbi:hypothetical protein [Maricaulis sp.]|uniref:hypothetical protein n=1 Tax=Maricaulis sp. TaxID=1486257 RepID=UPI001B29786E|nr:hypothetical protein [Maricaulis sp.]MBO6766544.1 hypothetical protein [Maricaulis sp.]MED5549838.1 hypothetical protein [Pseudomonadota bacterium]
MKHVRVASVAVSIWCASMLSGCITSPEEQEALRQAELEEQLQLQAMIEAGECRERPMTGMRTRTVYECGPENTDRTDAVREGMRRIDRQGGLCGGGSAACSPE